MSELTPQEFADKEFAKGWKEGQAEMICEMISLVGTENMEYVFDEIHKRIMHQLKLKRDKESKTRWG